MKKSKAIILSSLLGAIAISGIVVGIINHSRLSTKSDSYAPVLERSDGYKLRFKAIENASSYIVNDTTDYRDGLVLTNNDKDENGFIYYETETVGTHNVTITSYVDGNSYVSNQLTVNNKPMFFYGIPNCVRFYNVNTGSSANNEYSILQEDGTYLIVTQSEFNTTYNKNKYNAVDFSDADHVDEVIYQQKEAGANVLYISHRLTSVEEYSYWWFPGNFENSVVKRFMDAAWRYGMKCIINDFPIQVNCTYGDASRITGRMNNSELRKAFMHPAFYGIQFSDEPSAEQMANVGVTARTIINYWQNDATLSQKPLPFLYTALRSYDENRSEEYGYFEDKTAYKNYLKSWINETGLDYFAFDTYTYSTRFYGNKSSWGTKYYYDPSKVIYEAVNEVKEEIGRPIDVYQVLTGSTDSKRKTTVLSQDVFSSTFLAVSEDVSGYGIFDFQETLGSASACSDVNHKLTDTYYYVQSANKQYKTIQSLLEGYEKTSNSISINGAYSSNRLYGKGVRTSTTTFTNKNDNSKTYQFITNFESDATNTTYSVTVPSNRIYYLFGYNQKPCQRVGDGSNITLNNGEAILLSSETIDNVADVSFDKSRLDDYDVLTIKDLAGQESINNTDGFAGNPSTSDSIVRYSAVNSINGSAALKFNYRCTKLGSAWGDGNVDIDINNIWDNGHQYSIGCNSGDVYLKTANHIIHNVLHANEDNIVEVGAVKVKNTNQTYTYIKVNGSLIVDELVTTKGYENIVHVYLDSGDSAGTGVSLRSVNVHHKTSGAIKNVSGDASNIYFDATNVDHIPYSFANGSTTSLTPVESGYSSLTKIGYNRYRLALSSATPANTERSIRLTSYYFNNLDKKALIIPETVLYYTGSTWVDIGDLNNISSSITLGYTCEFKGGQIRNDSFKMKFAIDNSCSEAMTAIGEFGIYVSTSSKTKYYSFENTHLDTINNERYVIIDLGAAVSNNHQNDVFTTGAYLKVDGTIILSSQSTSGSIVSIVDDLYSDPSTRNSVIKLYTYLHAHD
jgi:uncharacterized HAD superfamily protein